VNDEAAENRSCIINPNSSDAPQISLMMIQVRCNTPDVFDNFWIQCPFLEHDFKSDHNLPPNKPVLFI